MAEHKYLLEKYVDGELQEETLGVDEICAGRESVGLVVNGQVYPCKWIDGKGLVLWYTTSETDDEPDPEPEEELSYA